MQQVFIELYNYRPAWANCPESERTDFAKKVVEAVKGLKSAGVDVVAYGMNSPETDRRAPYDADKVETEPLLRRELAPRISGTEFIVLPGVGHLSPLGAPSELAAAITTAISKIR